MGALRTIYKWWAALLVVGVLVQIGAAGYGAFYVAGRLDDPHEVLAHEGFENGWDFHSGFGYFVVLGAIVLFVLALAGRVGRPGIWWALAVPLLGILQILLAWFGSNTPAIGIFHPLNAFLILATVGLIAHREWRAGEVSRRAESFS